MKKASLASDAFVSQDKRKIGRSKCARTGLFRLRIQPANHGKRRAGARHGRRQTKMILPCMQMRIEHAKCRFRCKAFGEEFFDIGLFMRTFDYGTGQPLRGFYPISATAGRPGICLLYTSRCV